jgi:hypothetical protein
MSDIPAGWAQLIALPLGPETPEDVPLGALPCLFPLEPAGPARTVAPTPEGSP